MPVFSVMRVYPEGVIKRRRNPKYKGLRATSHKPRLPIEERIKTLDLYIRHQSTEDVGRELNISASAARDRLKVVGAMLRPRGSAFDPLPEGWYRHNINLLADLKCLAQMEHDE